MLQQKIPAIKPDENGDDSGASAAAAKGFIDQYFGKRIVWQVLYHRQISRLLYKFPRVISLDLNSLGHVNYIL